MSSKYTKEILEEAIKDSVSVAAVLRKLGLRQSGGNHSHITRRLRYFNIDISHFKGQAWNRNGIALNRRTPENILILRTSGPREKVYLLRRALIESGREFRCEICGVPPKWNNEFLQLEIDHINRDWLDDRKENLRFLCPNCHSQV